MQTIKKILSVIGDILLLIVLGTIWLLPLIISIVKDNYWLMLIYIAWIIPATILTYFIINLYD